MSREKQIDEMVEVISKVPPIVYPFSDRRRGKHFFIIKHIAEHLYNAGYRKQSEGLLIASEMSDEDIIALLRKSPVQIYQESAVEVITDDKEQAWISVEERLPDTCGAFLVVVKAKLLWKSEWEYSVEMACFNVSKIPSVNGWEYEPVDGYEHIITHWMPLPEAPKMKGGAE